MKPTRRNFLSRSLLGTIGTLTGGFFSANCANQTEKKSIDSSSILATFPLVIATWPNVPASQKAMDILKTGGTALDAVEAGVRLVESDPENQSVGLGGLPDRDGNVTLDACIMDQDGNCGSVCFLQNIKHPISVARKVMEETPHVILAGNGAFQFALSKGFKKENLLTEKSKLKWEEWKKNSQYKPIINVENHDTIGMLAIDQKGNISGACTTSGLAYKLAGRVGDSPIIGAGLYIDNEVGGAAATGMGEAVLKSLGSFLVVELMRQGRSPQEACKEAIERIINKQNYKEFQVGYVAVNKKGEYGAYCIQSGFQYSVVNREEERVEDAKYFVEYKEK